MPLTVRADADKKRHIVVGEFVHRFPARSETLYRVVCEPDAGIAGPVRRLLVTCPRCLAAADESAT